MNSFTHSVRQRAQRLKIDALALSLAVRHPRTPWYAKLLVAGLVAYVLTPVDFVPDVVPIFGFVDDLVFIPLALGLAGKLVPAPVLAACRGRAEELALSMRMGRAGWLATIAIWLALATVGFLWL
jgi:uncharacterized membrane protein YkvA (DUF1232 family)